MCYEHQRILDVPERLSDFSDALLETLSANQVKIAAWCVLPDHYHALAGMTDWKALGLALGRLHGRTSHEWNQEDGRPGRKVWAHCYDRVMRSNRHYWVTVNYIHNNPIHHGLVRRLQEWPWSSFHEYLAKFGRDWLKELWLNYPLKNYGKKWDR